MRTNPADPPAGGSARYPRNEIEEDLTQLVATKDDGFLCEVEREFHNLAKNCAS